MAANGHHAALETVRCPAFNSNTIRELKQCWHQLARCFRWPSLFFSALRQALISMPFFFRHCEKRLNTMEPAQVLGNHPMEPEDGAHANESLSVNVAFRGSQPPNKDFEDLTQHLEQLTMKVQDLDESVHSDLLQHEQISAGVLSKLGVELHKKERKPLKIPQYSIEKVSEILDEELKSCQALIASPSAQVKKNKEEYEKIKQNRKLVRQMMEELKNEPIPPQDISGKVDATHKNFKTKLHEIVKIVGADKHEEVYNILRELTSAYFNEGDSEGQSVDVSNYDIDIVQRLMANEIVTLNKE